MDRRASPSLVLLGHWLPACLNFWHYNWERCMASIRKTSWSHAFCFIFKLLTSKNIENKWSISKTMIVVSCAYLIYWPNKYIFTIFFFHSSTKHISLIELWSIAVTLRFCKSFFWKFRIRTWSSIPILLLKCTWSTAEKSLISLTVIWHVFCWQI